MILFPNFTSTEQAAEYVQDTFRWPPREPLALRSNPFPEDHHSFLPSFDLGVAMQYAYNSNILEMMHAIFYTMVLNDDAELGLGSRLSMDSMMSVLQKLDWAPIESWLGNIKNRLRRAQASHLVPYYD